MSFFMTLAKDNQITREFVNGTIWRQNRQIRRSTYELPLDLGDELARLGFPVVPYEVSPQPSPTAVLEQLDAAQKRIRELEKANVRLQKTVDAGPGKSSAKTGKPSVTGSRPAKVGKKILRALGLR